MVEVDVDLRPSFGDARDQGSLPICLTSAMSDVHQRLQPLNERLSAEYLHSCATGGFLSIGVAVDAACMALKDQGQPLESQCSLKEVDCPEIWQLPKGTRLYRRETSTPGQSIKAIKDAVRAGSTPVIGVSINEQFFDVEDPWIIDAGETRALHGMVAVGVGRQDGSDLILVRNSWGSDWGDDGHVWLTERYLERHLITHFFLTEAIE